MKHLILAVIIWVLCSGAATAEVVKRFNLDDAASIGTTIQTDSEVKIEGRGSVRITTRHPTTVCLGEFFPMGVENATLLYQAEVKSDLDGAAFLEMWVEIGGGKYFSRGTNDFIKGVSDWRMIQTPFLFHKGQRPYKITLNLVINGKGTVWVDSVRLLKKP